MNSTPSTSRFELPTDFTKPASSYRVQAWMAMFGLLLFIALYIGLASWFSYTTYRMIAGTFAGGDGAVAGFFSALPSGFLAIFMWKALFFVRPGSDAPGVEITATDEPQLFAFLGELADEVGAPRPHRVFVSPEVNACVFYDLSILNFIFPSKKNLSIGLGLVNSLNLSEFKAVLAHEFGHFAQRSMAVGRWVYIGEQIARHIIAKRDFLDRTLDFISSIDLRLAWIGWIMRAVVWSIRSLMETVFRLVIRAQRALSREMEFQADLVAVSVTGSDALIHALYRIQPADEDWETTLDFTNAQLNKGHSLTDLYAIHTRVGQHMRRVLNEPMHGLVPAVPVSDALSHRLFTEQIAQPPKMWATHPPNTEREENAKRTYVPASVNEDEAWTLFTDPSRVREAVTEFVFHRAKISEEVTSIPLDEALPALDTQYAEEPFDPRYRGVYLGRSITTGVVDANQLIGEPPRRDEIADILSNLYPDTLHATLTEWRNLGEEVAMLEAIDEGIYDASGGVIRHEGETIPRKQLPELIARVKQQREQALQRIEEHDLTCRTAHHAAARYVAQGWQEYLANVRELLHYAEHSEADLNDAYGHLVNVMNMAIAAGRVSSAKRRRVVQAANDLQQVMADLDQHAEDVALPNAVTNAIDVENWRAALDKLELPPANEQNIGNWMDVVDSWVQPMRHSFGKLRKASLEELLKTERYISDSYLAREEATHAPKCGKLPSSYAKRPRGKERPRQKKLDWWSRFTLADGTGPAILRFGVASTIVAAVVAAGAFVGNATVVVYNGLAVAVDVELNGQHVAVGPQRHKSFSAGAKRRASIRTTTADGRLIESFEATIDKGFAHYVYNVASAAPMVEWTAVYGSVSQPEPRQLGCPRWRTTGVNHIFTDPPVQTQTSGSGGTRTVLGAFPELSPQQLVDMVSDSQERDDMILAHARWDSSDHRFIGSWLTLASQLSEYSSILSSRLEATPSDVMTLRFQQDSVDGEEKEELLNQHRSEAAKHPNNSGWQYIAIRAMPDGPEQDAAFLEGLEKWPTSVWFNYASGFIYARQTNWEQALKCFDLPTKQRGAVYEGAAFQVARLRRLTSEGEAPDLSDLHDATQLQQLLTLESGNELQGTKYFAYSLLNQGKIEEAYRVAGGESAEPHLLVLLAASQGAKAEWQQQALKIPLDEVNDYAHLLYLAVVAHQLDASPDPFLQAFEEQFHDKSTSPINVVKEVIQSGLPEDIEGKLQGLDLRERGLVLSVANMMYPDETSDIFRDQARRLLFATERPWF